MTIVSVVSCAGSGSHRKEMRVENRHDDEVGLPVLAMIEMQSRSVVLSSEGVWWEETECSTLQETQMYARGHD